VNAAPTLPWPDRALQAALRARLPGLCVQVLASTGSTNTDLVERLRGGDATPVLRVAEHQTAGRGRNGRAWAAAPGASLTFSLGLPLAPADWSGLSLAVGVSLAQAIEPRPVRLQLKWPNDLWLADGPARWRKLGGILIETVPLPGGERGCVIGIGLNVRPRGDLPGLSSGYACVQELEPGLEAPALLERVAAPLLAALARFEREGFAPFAAGFAARDLLRGHRVETTLAERPEGMADGVDPGGALRLRHAAGVALLHSGEVSVRPLPAPVEPG